MRRETSGLLLLAALAGCSRVPQSTAPARNVFRYPIANVPTSLDPAKAQDGDTISILNQVYEGLVTWNEKSEVAPCLASNWELSKDRCTYTFHLLPGVKFSDGKELTAGDFKACFERNCNPEMGSPTATHFLSDIVGAREAIDGKRLDIPGLVAADPHTLQIRIDKPRPYFLQKLTVPVAYVYDLRALADPLKEMRTVEEMAGTGAFKVTDLNGGQQVLLEGNPLYRSGQPTLERVERPYVADAATRLAMYKGGKLDLVRLERQEAVTCQADPTLRDQLHFFPRPALWYFGINCSLTPGFGDSRVRQALAMGVDRERIVKDVLGGVNPSATCIVPPGVFGHRDAVRGIGFDPGTAQKLLAAAGHLNGAGLPEIEISYRTNRPDMRLVAEAVGQELSKNLQLKVNYQAVEWGKLLRSFNKKQVPFVVMRWSADFLDAQNFLTNLLSSVGNGNSFSYRNPQFDKLCEQADDADEPATRQRLYGQAEDIALNDAVMIPICFEQDAELISPHVHGVRNCLVAHLPYTAVKIR